MNLEACTEAIRTKVGADSGLAATLKFDCGDDGFVYIDGQSTPNTVSNENRDADCTVGIKLEDLNALLTGDLPPDVLLDNDFLEWLKDDTSDE